MEEGFMRLAVLGAGQQGIACVLDLLQQPDVREVRVYDSDADRLDSLRDRFRDERLRVATLDCGNGEELTGALGGCDAAVSAVPYFLNLAVTRAAIAARTHLVDLGGNTDVVFQQRSLDREAREAGIAVLPDQGLAPGLAGILAAHGFRDFDRVDSARLRVGGLPQRPRGPLGYSLVFSIHGLLNEYAGEAVGLEGGEIRRWPTLTGLERIRFPMPIGITEAAYTSGGTSTLPWTFQGKVGALDYKTLRYPGHWSRLRLLKELGMLETRPVPMGRVKVAPREALAAVLGPVLQDPEVRDLVVLRVRVRGRRGGQAVLRQYDLVDYYDERTGMTAMMRTTAFPAAESALLLARGMIRERGVLAAETAVEGSEYLRRLRARGISIREIEAEERGR
jgi:lysine 6-dehydrogenase